MKIKFALFAVFFLIQACSTFSTHSSHPACPAMNLGPASVDDVLGLWECGDKDTAKRIAYDGAMREDREFTILHLEFLAAENNLQSGLLFAMKGAERGDIGMAELVMRIDFYGHSSSLQELINRWFYLYFKQQREHTFIRLDEYLDYALSRSEQLNYLSVPYAVAFSQRVRSDLSSEETVKTDRKIIALMEKVTSEEKRRLIQAQSIEIFNDMLEP